MVMEKYLYPPLISHPSSLTPHPSPPMSVLDLPKKRSLSRRLARYANKIWQRSGFPAIMPVYHILEKTTHKHTNTQEREYMCNPLHQVPSDEVTYLWSNETRTPGSSALWDTKLRFTRVLS